MPFDTLLSLFYARQASKTECDAQELCDNRKQYSVLGFVAKRWGLNRDQHTATHKIEAHEECLPPLNKSYGVELAAVVIDVVAGIDAVGHGCDVNAYCTACILSWGFVGGYFQLLSRNTRNDRTDRSATNRVYM